MASGKVLQFDHIRGYGFVAADDGGEDVFLHASVFAGDSNELTPGTAVEFEIMAGDRGRKAYGAHLCGAALGIEERHITPVIPEARRAPVAVEEEQMCDVLSATEFKTELTEMLIRTVPGLTGPQIIEVRQGMLELAANHGWLDG